MTAPITNPGRQSSLGLKRASTHGSIQQSCFDNSHRGYDRRGRAETKMHWSKLLG